MKSVRRAVIDVGTNSVKLLVADVAGCDVRPVLEQSRQTRLGRGFYQSHTLQPQAVEATAQAVAAFAIAARDQKAQSVRVVATSVAREANNAGELASAIMRASGLPLEIISGDQEAEWVFQGVATDPALAGLSLLILDIGGGSSEFILGSGAHKHFQASYPLGSVRLMEKLPHSDPPTAAELARCRNWLRDFLDSKVAPELCPALNRETASESPQPVHCASVPEAVQLVGTGGTASILACMELQLSHFDRARIESTPLGLRQVQGWTERLWGSPLSERKKIVGLPPNRADVILYGTAIYEAVMVRFEFDQLRISTRGLRFGAILQGQ